MENENLPTRTNNPGDLKFIGQTGATQDQSGFASFTSPKDGYAALLNDVQSKINKSPNETLADFSNTYAPPTENNSAQYTANLANHLGVAPDSKLSSLQPQIGKFAEAIGNNEGFKDINSNPSPTPQEVQDNTAKPVGDSSHFNPWNLLWGVPLVAGTIASGAVTGGATEAAVPEELAALGIGDATGATSEGGGLLSKAGNAIKGLVTSKVGQIAEGVGAEDLINSGISGNSGSSSGSSQGSQSNAEDDTTAEKVQQEQNVNNEDLEDEKESQEALQNSKLTSSAYLEALNQTSTGKKLTQTDQGQMGINALSKYGIAPNVEDGKYASQASYNEVGNLAQEIDDKEQDIHTASGDTGNLSELEKEAKDSVRKDNRIPSTEYAAADKVIEDRIKHYREQMGDSPALGRGGIGLIRSDGYKSFDKNATTASNAAGRALGRAGNAHMLNHSQSKDLIDGLHKEKEGLIHARTVLKHLNGKKALEKQNIIQRALKGSGEAIGIAIGDKLGGPIGAVIGDVIGKNLIREVDRRHGKTLFEKPALKKALDFLHSKDPKVYAKIEKELKRYGVKTEQKKQNDIKESHQAWQSENMARAKNEKRKAYQEKKNPKDEPKKSEYEPYTKPGVIKFGTSYKKEIPKDAVSFDTAPDVFGPNKKKETLRNKRPELYEKYTEPGVINFGKSGISNKKKFQKGLPVIR